MYNHHWEPPQALENVCLIPKDKQKMPHWNGLEGQKHGMCECHTHVWKSKIRRNILAVEVPSKWQGVPAPLPGPPPSIPDRKTNPHGFCCENRKRLWLCEKESFWNPRHFCYRASSWTYLDLPLSSCGAAALKVVRTYREELNHLTSGEVPEWWLSPREKCWQTWAFFFFFAKTSLHRVSRQVT